MEVAIAAVSTLFRNAGSVMSLKDTVFLHMLKKKLKNKSASSICLRESQRQLQDLVLDKLQSERFKKIRQKILMIDRAFNYFSGQEELAVYFQVKTLIDLGSWEDLQTCFSLSCTAEELLSQRSRLINFLGSSKREVKATLENLRYVVLSNLMSERLDSELSPEDLALYYENIPHLCNNPKCVELGKFVIEGNSVNSLHCRIVTQDMYSTLDLFTIKFKIAEGQACEEAQLIPVWLKEIFPQNLSTCELPEPIITRKILDSKSISFSNSISRWTSPRHFEITGKTTDILELTVSVLNLLIPLTFWKELRGFEEQNYTRDSAIYFAALHHLATRRNYPTKKQVNLSKSSRVRLSNYLYLNFHKIYRWRPIRLIEKNLIGKEHHYVHLNLDIAGRKVLLEPYAEVVTKEVRQLKCGNHEIRKDVETVLDHDICILRWRKVSETRKGQRVKTKFEDEDEFVTALYKTLVEEIQSKVRRTTRIKTPSFACFKNFLKSPILNGTTRNRIMHNYYNLYKNKFCIKVKESVNLKIDTLARVEVMASLDAITPEIERLKKISGEDFLATTKVKPNKRARQLKLHLESVKVFDKPCEVVNPKFNIRVLDVKEESKFANMMPIKIMKIKHGGAVIDYLHKLNIDLFVFLNLKELKFELK
jgi:hypothetical protein